MKRIRTLFALALVCLGTCVGVAADHQRMIVLTDMGADPDDQESMVRLMLYSNQIDIEGLVATTSVWSRSVLRPEFITRIVEAYGAVQPNLLLHEPGFPSADTLLATIKRGLPAFGMAGVGEGHDCEGSDWIVAQLEKPDDRPLWVSVWGGANTLAQALTKIDRTKPAAEAARLRAKLRVYTISDQDDSGAWIRRTYPDVFYIVSPGDHYDSATWIAMNTTVDGIDNSCVSNAWIARNIQQGHGPLGAAYPDVSWGMEGDTPAFLSLIPNGLNTPEHPGWGGWGGRYELKIPDPAAVKEGGSDVVTEPVTRPIWTDTSDSYRPHKHSEYGRPVARGDRVFTGQHVTLWRWRDDFQNDFAARMDWATKPFAAANHPPVPVLAHPELIDVKAGASFELNAIGSLDPDGDSLSFLWFNYPEAGTWPEPIEINGADNCDRASFTAPMVSKPETLHFILRVTDKGTPALSRYKRVIVTVIP